MTESNEEEGATENEYSRPLFPNQRRRQQQPALQWYLQSSPPERKKEKGKQFMLWGVIALTVMVSVWGLVGVLSSTFGVRSLIIPQVTPPRSP